MNKIINYQTKLKGSFLPVVMLSSLLFISFAIALCSIAIANVKRGAQHEKQISSLDIAEAGANYYLWHLSHDNKDYCDGTSCSGDGPFGPFSHDYNDQNGNLIGKYDLFITPPTNGDSVVTVKSVGKVVGTNKESVVIAELGMPSFAKYSFLSNTECWFGSNETTNGPVHSNIGVHFDGTANGIISAASKTYTPTSAYGGDDHTSQNGVWGDGGPSGFWVYPVPQVDFTKVSADFAKLRTEATESGIILGDSNGLGYYLLLKENNTIDVYKVTKEKSNGITTSFIRNYAAPSNGVLFANDHVWVDGKYNDKITIAAEIPAGNKDAKIKIKGDILYKTKDGSSNIGLVSEGNIEVTAYAPDNLEIDAALLSQKGHVWFPNSGVVKNNISIYGSISTNLNWTWTWVNNEGVTTAGYHTTNQAYDPYLTLSPPPQFPTTGSFAILSWREE